MSHIHHIHPPRQPPTHTYTHAHTHKRARAHIRTHLEIFRFNFRNQTSGLLPEAEERRKGMDKEEESGKIARPSPLIIKVYCSLYYEE